MNSGIGWFGIPGRTPRSTKTHVVRYGGEPICGSHLNSDMEFQWCAPVNDRNHDFIECRRCRAKLRSEQKESTRP